MLRHGAASAVAVENNGGVVRDGEFLKAAFEWLDNRNYDLRFIHGSVADLPAWGLGRFDVVTALCSLYYVDEARMRDIARYVRTLTNLFVLQCNTDRLIQRSEEDRYRRASVEFALELLEHAGFAERQVIAPPDYSRPLVIGRATG
jgi:SAM-dependent methyltransferase